MAFCLWRHDRNLPSATPNVEVLLRHKGSIHASGASHRSIMKATAHGRIDLSIYKLSMHSAKRRKTDVIPQ